MWRFLAAMFVVFVLVQLGSGTRDARADSIEISDRVWGHFQEYLVTLGPSKPGAFAVSSDGGSSYYIYCQDVRCRSGTTYSHEAVSRCESSTGRDCVLFALRREIQVAYTQVPDPAPAISANPAPAAVVSEPEEPPFESPLADGTIVLSRKVAADLDAYLAAIENHSAHGFFYVAPNGREAGMLTCSRVQGGVLPRCPMKAAVGWSEPRPNITEAKERAMTSCKPEGGECVMLYSDDTQRADYKVVQ